MIHRMYSTLPTFKELRFQTGLNVLLAERSEGATERQTRNRAGKSSLVEIVHFLLGSNAGPKSIFRNEELSDHRFGMAFDLPSGRTVVERSGSSPSRVIVREATAEDWPIKPRMDKDTGEQFISNSNWRSVLGVLMFGLSDGTGQDKRYSPSFRALFAYFARRQSASAFNSPWKQSEQQHVWDQQVMVTYLLGLDWTIPQRWQELRDREKQVTELRKVASQGTLGKIMGAAAQLRTDLAVGEGHARRLRESVESFLVLPEYRNLEAEASELTRAMGALANENTIDRELLSELQQALEREADPTQSDLERLYEEVGIALPGTAIRRLAEVRAFHRSVTENRRSYLSGEIEAAEGRIVVREDTMRKLDARRADIMGLLRSRGALDHLNRLQKELTQREADVEVLRRRFAAAEELEGLKTDLDIEKQQLLRRLRQDYREQQETLNQAIVTFEEISRDLYEEAGNLTIEESLGGPRFDVTIQGAKSKGIGNMQIFCFDMTLMRLCSRRGLGPRFLVHDSHLFDGVDERQVAAALRLGARTAEEEGFQYIVTMNSDAVPGTSFDDFDIYEHVLPVHVTDATEEGGLFGLRF